MDLYAYSKIEEISKIATQNGIEVPRLRGYRLMSNEHEVSKEKIAEAIKDFEGLIYRDACVSVPRFRPNSCEHEYSDATDRMREKYLLTEEVTEVSDDGESYTYERVIGFRWDLVHGKNKKAIKLAIKQKKREIVKNLTTFNKYVGRNDVLYIHARIGGNNWAYYGGGDIERQPWFLEKVDDYFDDTYCDIYAKINTEVKNEDI